MSNLFYLFDALPPADMKCEIELQRASAPQLRREKQPCCGGQAEMHLVFPTQETREDSQLQVLLCCTVKSDAEQRRGWRRIRAQTKQTTHRRSPKLTAKQVVNNPPVDRRSRNKDARGIELTHLFGSLWKLVKLVTSILLSDQPGCCWDLEHVRLGKGRSAAELLKLHWKI